MPDVFIILGKSGMRKSPTIRALTGRSQRGGKGRGKENWQIATIQKGNIDIFVQIGSLQEKGISPEKFIAEINKGSYPNVLVCLWIKKKDNERPDGATYIQEFVDKEWNIREVVVLTKDKNLPPNYLPKGTPNPNYIYNSQSQPANQIASKIRKWWKWS